MKEILSYITTMQPPVNKQFPKPTSTLQDLVNRLGEDLHKNHAINMYMTGIPGNSQLAGIIYDQNYKETFIFHDLNALQGYLTKGG